MAIERVERGLITGREIKKRTQVLGVGHEEFLQFGESNHGVRKQIEVTGKSKLKITTFSPVIYDSDNEGVGSTEWMTLTGEEITRAKIKAQRTSVLRRKPLFRYNYSSSF